MVSPSGVEREREKGKKGKKKVYEGTYSSNNEPSNVPPFLVFLYM